METFWLWTSTYIWRLLKNKSIVPLYTPIAVLVKSWVVLVLCILPTSFVAAQQGLLREAVQRRDMLDPTAHASALLPLPEVEYEEEYRFPLSLLVTGTTLMRDGRSQKSEVRYYVNPQHAWLATVSQCEKTANAVNGALALYDFENRTMLLLTPSRKTGMAMDLSAAQYLKAGQATEENWKCRRTGARKVIVSLRCEQCLCTDETRNLSSSMWITRDIAADLAPSGVRSAFGSQLRAAQMGGGVLVEGSFFEGGKLRTAISVKEVNHNANFTISLNDYQLR